MNFTLDIEATGLLDCESIDYTNMPYKLKTDFKIHCIVLEDQDSGEVFVFTEYAVDPQEFINFMKDIGTFKTPTFDTLLNLPKVISKAKSIVAHNGIGYDYPLLSLWYNTEYSIGKEGLAFPNGKWPKREDHLFDSWGEGSINFEDSLIMSKLLNPDRRGGHSLEDWGKRSGLEKVDIVAYTLDNLNLWLDDEEISDFFECVDTLNKTTKKKLIKKIYFSKLTNHLIYYCIIDTVLCTKVWNKLQVEKAGWDWEQAYNTELMVADIIQVQEHVGFKYDQELARKNYKELSIMLKDIEEKVEPLLPGRPLTKKEEVYYTPPSRQVKQDLTLSSGMESWIAEHGVTIIEEKSWEVGKRVIKTLSSPTRISLYGEELDFPLKKGCIKTKAPMKISDHVALKEHIVGLGWSPSVWAETDLTLSTDKSKKTPEQFIKSVDLYLSKKSESPFLPHVLKHKRVKSFSELVRKFRSHDLSKPLKVYTSPKYVVDAEKTLDPSLVLLGERVAYIKDVVYWLTYTHRRNSIFSSVENSESKDEDSGWSSNKRLAVDGRIPTPADTLGCNTGRLQHKGVANVPRVSSVYGEKMRRLFCCSEGSYLLGADSSGLENRVAAYYALPYNEGRYCESLYAEKPNDSHTLLADKLGIRRDEAKTLGYLSLYGGGAPRAAASLGWPLSKAKVIVEEYWQESEPTAKFKEELTGYWKTSGGRQFILGLDGRKIITRSEHSLLNSQFQSSGTILMKITMIMQDRELKRRGLYKNVFKDRHSKAGALQVLFYHDELEEEVSKDLVKWRKFNSEEEAVSFKITEGRGSEVISKGGSYFVALCEVGDVMHESMAKAGEYVNMGIPFTSDWAIGKNWAEIH